MIEVFINGELVPNDVSSDMLLSTGWEDIENSIYCEQSENGLRRFEYCFSSEYSHFVGNDEVTICVHPNRVVAILTNCKGIIEGLPEDAEFIVKRFYLSSILTEYHADRIGFNITRVEDHIETSMKFDDIDIRINIPIDL